MLTHTGEDPEINQIWIQNQAKQDDWPKERQKKCPYKWFKLPQGHNSLWAHPCVPIHIYSFAPNKYFTCFTTFHFFMEIDFLQSCTGQALVTGQALSMTTGPRWFSGWYSAGLLPWPEFILWLENRNTAPRCSGRVHLRSVWNTYIHTHIYNTHIYI